MTKVKAETKSGNQSNEHILVCLSPSPSNERIVRMAAQMAQAFGGTLTALYVQTPGNRALSSEDEERLQTHVRLATELGAEIVTTKRTLSAAEFFCNSPKVQDVLDDDEIVTRIDIPLSANLKGEYRKFRLRDAVDFAIVGVASAFHVADGKITDGKLVFGGVAPMPRIADDVVALLKDKPITEELAEDAASLAVKDAVALRYNAHKIVILKSMVKESILSINA